VKDDVAITVIDLDCLRDCFAFPSEITQKPTIFKYYTRNDKEKSKIWEESSDEN
jgi:hypothetical protein